MLTPSPLNTLNFDSDTLNIDTDTLNIDSDTLNMVMVIMVVIGDGDGDGDDGGDSYIDLICKVIEILFMNNFAVFIIHHKNIVLQTHDVSS